MAGQGIAFTATDCRARGFTLLNFTLCLFSEATNLITAALALSVFLASIIPLRLEGVNIPVKR